jgi:hypothetical protein
VSKGRKKTPTKIIEDELKRLGEIVYEEARATVRISKDTYDSDGNQINEGGSLRDSILPYAKGKRLTMSQLDYGKWQKPKEFGSTPWNPPLDRNSPQWDNPMMDSIKKNLPSSINVIAKDLIKNIVGK